MKHMHAVINLSIARPAVIA